MNNRIREQRIAKQLTQKQLAKLVEVSSRSIISIEKGEYNPSLLLAYRLAQTLGLPMEQLFCLAEIPEEEPAEEPVKPAEEPVKPAEKSTAKPAEQKSGVAYYLL